MYSNNTTSLICKKIYTCTQHSITLDLHSNKPTQCSIYSQSSRSGQKIWTVQSTQLTIVNVYRNSESDDTTLIAAAIVQ